MKSTAAHVLVAATQNRCFHTSILLSAVSDKKEIILPQGHSYTMLVIATLSQKTE